MPTMRAAERLDQAGGGGGRAAGGQHVVDDQDPLVGVDGVAVDLQLVGAVLQLVLLADDRPRQLAGLAHGDERGAEAVGDRRGEDEPARLDADDPVDLDVAEPVGQLVDRPAERGGVAEQRRDVAERDARLREVGDLADQRAAATVVGDDVGRASPASPSNPRSWTEVTDARAAAHGAAPRATGVGVVSGASSSRGRGGWVEQARPARARASTVRRRLGGRSPSPARSPASRRGRPSCRGRRRGPATAVGRSPGPRRARR